jgi:DNA-binding response OmpR family regulator
MVKVLMIDDDKDMCEEMAEILADNGIEVTAVWDPARGMKLALENKYDLLLLDLKMPEITGYEILHSVKALDAKIKVMVITGAPLKKIAGGELGQEDKLRNYILGMADEVVNKSADIGTILEKIMGLTHQD